MSDKPYDATPARRERARLDGDVARSTEANGIASFACALVATLSVLPVLGGAFVESLRASAARPGAAAPPDWPAVACAAAPALAACLGGTGLALAQGGGLHVRPLRIRLAQLAPHAGLKRMFGGEALVAAARAAAAFAAAGLAAGPAVRDGIAAAAAAATPGTVAAAALGAAARAAWAACAAAALFALADYALARRRWLHGLRMTLDELRRDLKESDGDPQTKSQRRRLHRALGSGGVARVRDASFVVVNPLHVAVALRYAPPAVPVPEIVVRAVDDAALRVRRLAQEAGIPIVSDVALARLLHRSGETGRPIPVETFVAVAEVVAALIRAGRMAP